MRSGINFVFDYDSRKDGLNKDKDIYLDCATCNTQKSHHIREKHPTCSTCQKKVRRNIKNCSQKKA